MKIPAFLTQVATRLTNKNIKPQAYFGQNSHNLVNDDSFTPSSQTEADEPLPPPDDHIIPGSYADHVNDYAESLAKMSFEEFLELTDEYLGE